MQKLIKHSITLFLFWLLVFFCNRLFFVVYQLPLGHKITNYADVFIAFVAGYKLDFATAIILLLLPLLFVNVYFVFQQEVFKKIAFRLSMFFLILYTMISLGDAGLYHEWNAKINMQALAHFKHPAEILRTVSSVLLIEFIALLALFTFPFYFLFKNQIHKNQVANVHSSFKKRLIQGVLFLLVSTAIGVIIIRGGISNLPMNQNAAYFSQDALANNIAVNPLYSLLQDMTITKNIPDEQVYIFRTNEEANALITEDFSTLKDSSISILHSTRPNLLFIHLEGWSADNMEILGGIKGCTPQFEKICQEGLLFTKAYAAAYVSDQGIPAVLSAYPAVSRVAIINQVGKVHKLPCISEDLIQEKYNSSFLYGGDLIFGNFRGYFLEKKFSNLVEVKDLGKYPQGKLGVHDEYGYQELLQELSTRDTPFLQCYFTLSTHMPYDYKSTDTWQSTKEDVEKKYTESMHYADIQLGKFFEAAKQQAWYKNTLIILVSDHSHNSIKQQKNESPERHHIPMLFTGGALKPEWQNKQWTKIVSQVDILSTIYHQMNLDASAYPWSRNMLNATTPSSAYYVFYGGIGYINDNGYVASIQNNPLMPTYELKDTSQLKHMTDKALSFQQLIYEDVKNR